MSRTSLPGLLLLAVSAWACPGDPVADDTSASGDTVLQGDVTGSDASHGADTSDSEVALDTTSPDTAVTRDVVFDAAPDAVFDAAPDAAVDSSVDSSAETVADTAPPCASDLDCDDGNACTDDACNLANGACVNVIDVANPCDDGDPCTPDSCVADGSCASGPSLDCDDGNLCTDDSCDGGACANTPNSDPCDDGSDCTTNDLCAQGSCVGEAVRCEPPSSVPSVVVPGGLTALVGASMTRSGCLTASGRCLSLAR